MRGRLGAEGIECFLKDELTVAANPFLSNAVGGVKLQVRGEDVERATAILNEWTNAPEIFERNDPEAEIEDAVHLHCPYCQSDEIMKQKKLSGIAFALSVFLLGFPLPFLRGQYHCFGCGQNFKVRKAR